MAEAAPIPERLRRLDPERVEALLHELPAEDLAALVRLANQEYWEHNAARFADTLYDRLVERLRALDPHAGVLSELGQPVPSGPRLRLDDAARMPPAERFGQPVEHDRLMLSLDKVYGPEDLESWADKIEGDFLVMPKLDGVACSLRYRNGALVLAATRGSGSEGEDITMNVLQIPGLPTQAGDADFEIRGEVFMALSAFEEFKEQYANPRNLTAGSLKNKDAANSRTHALSFGAYDIIGPQLGSERDKFALLAKLCIPAAEHEFVDRASLRAAFARLSDRRANLGYEIDGVVYRADLVAEQDRLGTTGHHPRYAMAYKFQGDTGETVLEDVMWSLSRSGTITPVARVVPIELSGATISRISLHNLSRFVHLDVRRGSTVEVTRRGGVIPHIERTVTRGDGSPFALPARCPACGNDVAVRKKRDGEFLQCVDPENCTEARQRELEHFAKVVDMQGFGPKAITQLSDAGLLSSPADFYRLRVEDISGLDRLGDKSARNLIDQVDAHRELTLPTFLQALGIDHLGQQNALLLAGVFGTLERVRAATFEDLVAIKGIKDAIANALVDGLASHCDLIDALVDQVAVLEYSAPRRPEVGDKQAPLAGLSFVFTGTLESLDRKTAQARARDLGADTPSGVGAGLTHLVIGAGKGAKSSKQKKGEKMLAAGDPLQIITEQAFVALLGEHE